MIIIFNNLLTFSNRLTTFPIRNVFAYFNMVILLPHFNCRWQFIIKRFPHEQQHNNHFKFTFYPHINTFVLARFSIFVTFIYQRLFLEYYTQCVYVCVFNTPFNFNSVADLTEKNFGFQFDANIL